MSESLASEQEDIVEGDMRDGLPPTSIPASGAPSPSGKPPLPDPTSLHTQQIELKRNSFDYDTTVLARKVSGNDSRPTSRKLVTQRSSQDLQMIK